MSIFLRRMLAFLVLLAACLTIGSDRIVTAKENKRPEVAANSAVVMPFQNCSDLVTSNCIVSVKYNDTDISFAGNVQTDPSLNCDEPYLKQSATKSTWCYQDSVPAYTADPEQLTKVPQRTLRVLIAKSPEAFGQAIPGGPSFKFFRYTAHFDPVIVNPGQGANGERMVSRTESLLEDSWTVKINFGPVPPPNFYAQAGIDSYVISYDLLGNTIIELKIRPLTLTYPGDEQRCKALKGGNDVTTIGLTTFTSTALEGDTMRKLFRFTNGFSVASNSTCTTAGFRIAEDGEIQTAVEANHLKADGSLYEGYFSAVVSPLALQGFNVSPDLVTRGGLKIMRTENGKTFQLRSTSEIQPDGSVRITATGFHYSGGTISITKNKKMAQPAGKTTVTSAVKAFKAGTVTRIKVNAKKATGRVHLSILGPKGLKWSMGSGNLENGVANVDVVVPRSIPKGKTSLYIWYEGSRSVRPATKILNVVVR